jgi:pimeloyl-ACP methyl ester carboxylesterase
MMPRTDGRSPRLEEARRFLAGPDFIPAESKPARVEFNGQLNFKFPTPRPSEFDENNVVLGRLYHCAQRWQERPVVILLHGWNDATDHYLRFPFIARRFNRAGFNAVTLVEPYQFERRPRRLGAWSNFLCPDLLRTAEAAAQGIAEIRAVTGWLLKEGCPRVALWGVSLGSWLSGLTVCRDARFAAAVLTVPVVRMERVIEELAFCQCIRDALQGKRLDAPTLNLDSGRPVIPSENILLIESTHDRFVPKETVEELWQAWGRPEIWRLAHGHLSFMLKPGLTGRVLRWIAPRLNGPDATKTGFRQD